MTARTPVEIYPDHEALVSAAARRLIHLGRESIERRGIFSLVLSGGSTPLAVYERLASLDAASHLDWGKVHLFWGDERCVPPDHGESNYGAARRTLLAEIPIPEENIHRIRGEEAPEKAAAEYENEIRSLYERRNSVGVEHMHTFDLVLLGLGEDGHTASLFPGAPALNEKVRWVSVVEHNQPPPPLVPRVTLTLPVINAARQVLFIVSGKSKAGILARALGADENPPLPAQRVQPGADRLLWLVDQSAALNVSSE